MNIDQLEAMIKLALTKHDVDPERFTFLRGVHPADPTATNYGPPIMSHSVWEAAKVTAGGLAVFAGRNPVGAIEVYNVGTMHLLASDRYSVLATVRIAK